MKPRYNALRRLGTAAAIAGMLLGIMAPPQANAATVASDDASSYFSVAGNGSWSPSNAGSGFGPWTFNFSSAGGTSVNGVFIDAGSQAISTGTKSWGFYANSANVADASRPFTNSLSAGQTFQIDLQFAGITAGIGHAAPPGNGSGDQAGFELRNGSSARWRFYFIGGTNNCMFDDNAGNNVSIATGGFPSGGFRVVFRLLTADTYEFTVLKPNAGTNIYASGTRTLMGTGGSGIDHVDLYCNNPGGGNNIYFNSMKIGYAAPAISMQPAGNTSNCSFTTVSFSIAASSTDGSVLSYAWRRRASGWGTNWVLNANGGNIFLTTSPEIDTGGKAWGLQQTTGTNATEAVRYLPATLAVNQTVSVDMDNKNITSGGSAGISLQDANTTNAFEFKFRGGDANYNINDSRGNLQNTGLPFTSTGLHLDYTLTSPSNYSLTIRRLSDGSTMTLVGTNISGVAIKRVRFFDFQSGAGNNIYFNNLVVAGADDNAGNYSSWSGDLGQRPLADGPTSNGSSYSGAATTNFSITSAQTADSASYDCAVMSGQGYTTISSASALTVNATPSATISAPSSVCANSTGNTASVPTQNGVAYAWAISNGTITAGSASNQVTYTAGASGSLSLSCAVTNSTSLCGSNSTVNLTITDNSAIQTQPASNTVCQGSTASFSIVATAVSAYQWQVSTNGGSSWDNVTSGTGATTTNFTTAATVYPGDNGNQYRCQLTGCGGATLDSDGTATLTVNPTSVGGTAAADTTSFCTSGSTTIRLTNNIGAIQWQASPDNTTYTNVPGASGGSYITPTLTQSTYYRAIVTSGLCPSATSSVAMVAISPASVGGTATADKGSLCTSGSTTIRLTNNTGAIQWQASPDNTTFTNIPNATNAIYTTLTLTQTTYYVAVVTSGVCSPATSSVATVTILTPAGIASGPTVAAVCQSNSATISVTGSGTAPSYAWRRRDSGWGNAWTFNGGGGGFFIGNSANNAGGGTGNINTGGKSWGIFNNNAGSVTEAIRAFPSALSVSNQFQIDIDNGYVTAGNGVGISLRNASSNAVWEFYFHGGDQFYTINDNTGAATNSAIPFTADGVRVIFTLTDLTHYSVTAQTKPVVGGGSSYGPFSGQLKAPAGGSVPAQIRLWSNNGNAPDTNYDVFFNSIVVNTTSDDNAANYSSWSGDRGQKPLVDGLTGNGSTITGSATDSMTISNAAPADTANYDLVVYNNCAAVTSSSVALTVITNGGLSITTQPASQTNHLGTSATFSVTAGSTCGTTNFQWRLNGNPLLNATNSSLTIAAVSPCDAGNYTVVITNASGSLTSDVAVLTVINDPSIISPGGSLNIGTQTECTGIIFNGGSAYNWELADASGSAGTGWDLLSLNGGINLRATTSNQFNLKLVSLTGASPGPAANFNNNTNYRFTIATTIGSVTNFSPAAFALDTSAFSNDLAGGVFLVQTGSLIVAFSNNHPPVAQTYTGNKSPGVTVQIPLSTLASFWGDPDGDPVALVSMDLLSTNHVTITTDTNFVYYNSTNTAEDEWSYVVRDVRSYRPNDTVRTAVGKIHLNPPPPAPFVISIVPLSDGNKRLIFNGYNKFVWHAQAASNLVPPIAWQTISSNFFPGVIQFDDLTATNFATRFYRFEGGGP